jgi:hypothetical protein
VLLSSRIKILSFSVLIVFHSYFLDHVYMLFSEISLR